MNWPFITILGLFQRFIRLSIRCYGDITAWPVALLQPLFRRVFVAWRLLWPQKTLSSMAASPPTTLQMPNPTRRIFTQKIQRSNPEAKRNDGSFGAGECGWNILPFFNLHFLLFQGEYQIIIRVVNEDNKNELACFQSTFEIKKRQSKSKKRRRKNERW